MRTSTAGNLTEASGFTLVELSVIVALLGIFTVLLIPRLDRFGRGDLDASARRLRGTIKFLFNEAALTGREHRLVYDLEHGSYRGMVLNPAGELTELRGPGKETRLPGGIRFQDLVLRNRGTFSTGEITVRIHPTGWLEESLVHLRDPEGAQRTLRITPLSGAADIYPGYRGF